MYYQFLRLYDMDQTDDITEWFNAQEYVTANSTFGLNYFNGNNFKSCMNDADSTAEYSNQLSTPTYKQTSNEIHRPTDDVVRGLCRLHCAIERSILSIMNSCS